MGVGRGGQRGDKGMERDFVWGDGNLLQCADGVLLSCILETCMVLLTNVILINSILKRTIIIILVDKSVYT